MESLNELYESLNRFFFNGSILLTIGKLCAVYAILWVLSTIGGILIIPFLIIAIAFHGFLILKGLKYMYSKGWID